MATEELTGYDEEATGHKNTECSWGMCQQNKKLWPDPQDYIWPYETDRVAPLRSDCCPLDARGPAKEGELRGGCFYNCKFFQAQLAHALSGGADPGHRRAYAIMGGEVICYYCELAGDENPAEGTVKVGKIHICPMDSKLNTAYEEVYPTSVLTDEDYLLFRAGAGPSGCMPRAGG